MVLELKFFHNKLGRRPTRHDSSSLNYNAKKYFGSWNNFMEFAGYSVNRIQIVSLPDIAKNSFYYFLGLLVTDGHMRFDKKTGDYKVAIYTSYKNEIKIVSNLIKDLFNYNPCVYKKKKCGFNKRYNYAIVIHSKLLVSYLNLNFKIPIGKKSLTVTLPLLSNRLECNSNFLRGVIDGDGCVRKNGNLSICSGSYLFLIGIKKLLVELGIKSSNVLDNGTCYNLYISMSSLPDLFYFLYHSGGYSYERRKKVLEQILNTKKILVFHPPIAQIQKSEDFERAVVERTAVENFTV